MSAIWLLLAGLFLGPQDPETVDPTPVQAQVEAARFEVVVIGSGAPEVLVWFGSDPVTEKERKVRRDLGTALGAAIGAGTGRVHLLVDLGPNHHEGGSNLGSVPFALDFPSLKLDTFQAECLQRADSRALAEYLVGSPALVGLVDLPNGGFGQAARTTSNLADFVHIGLGLGELAPELLEPSEGQSASELGAQAVLRALDLARISLETDQESKLHLGGDLWQFDLRLNAPQLSLVRPDSRRIYPRLRLGLELTSKQSSDQSSSATLVELAWHAEGNQAFERLALKAGRFEFPEGRLPSGVTLRVIARIPKGVSSVELVVDAGRVGRATRLLLLAQDPALEGGQTAEH